MRFSQVVCIMNPTAGTRRSVREEVVRTLKAADVPFEFWETARAGHATELAETAVQSGADLVVGIGGDGTINEIGRALVGTGVPLGSLPAGSGNALARNLGISLHPSKACRQLLRGDPVAFDVGQVGDAVFLSTAGVGLDAEVARRYAKRKGKRRGLLPYVMLTLSALRAFEPQPIYVTLDDAQTVEMYPVLLAVANTAQYGHGITIAPGATPDDGLLTVCVIPHVGWLQLGRNMVSLLKGTIHRQPGVSLFTAQKIRVERQASGWIQFDGEACQGPAVLEFGILPKALQVIYPAGDSVDG